MSKFATVAKIVGAILAVVLIGVLIGWLGSRGAPKQTTSASPTNASVDPGLSPLIFTNPIPAVKPTQAPPPAVHPSTMASVPTPANLITNWEDKVDEIIGPDGPEADKAKQLAALFPRLPVDGQVEVANHLSNLVSDQDYALIGNYLTNSALPEDVLDVFLADLLNRPNSIKLPMLLDVAQEPQNPKAAEAKDLLELFLDENYGDNWAQWQTHMQQWLQDNPD